MWLLGWVGDGLGLWGYVGSNAGRCAWGLILMVMEAFVGSPMVMERGYLLLDLKLESLVC